MNRIAFVPAALGLALAAAPALAELPEQRTVQVTTSGLKLGTPEGQKELNWRIERAVRDVCQVSTRDAGSRLLTADAKACIAKARNSAQQQVAALMAAQAQKGA